MTQIAPYSGPLWANRSVGLLGGSFNPAHEGHRHISLQAMKRLGLDAVWWMVSPRNPLKSEKDLKPLGQRVATARAVAKHPQIFVTDIEQSLGTRYTADTLKKLKAHYPLTRFIWLMGTDNLQQVHLWKHWTEIFAMVPVCVVDRPTNVSRLQSCPALERFRHRLMVQDAAPAIFGRPLPAWTILHTPTNAESSTRIRARRRK